MDELKSKDSSDVHVKKKLKTVSALKSAAHLEKDINTPENSLIEFERKHKFLSSPEQGEGSSDGKQQKQEISIPTETGQKESFPQEHFNTMHQLNIDTLKDIIDKYKTLEAKLSQLTPILDFHEYLKKPNEGKETVNDDIGWKAAYAWKKFENDANYYTWDQIDKHSFWEKRHVYNQLRGYTISVEWDKSQKDRLDQVLYHEDFDWDQLKFECDYDTKDGKLTYLFDTAENFEDESKRNFAEMQIRVRDLLDFHYSGHKDAERLCFHYLVHRAFEPYTGPSKYNFLRMALMDSVPTDFRDQEQLKNLVGEKRSNIEPDLSNVHLPFQSVVSQESPSSPDKLSERNKRETDSSSPGVEDFHTPRSANTITEEDTFHTPRSDNTTESVDTVRSPSPNIATYTYEDIFGADDLSLSDPEDSLSNDSDKDVLKEPSTSIDYPQSAAELIEQKGCTITPKRKGTKFELTLPDDSSQESLKFEDDIQPFFKEKLTARVTDTIRKGLSKLRAEGKISKKLHKEANEIIDTQNKDKFIIIQTEIINYWCLQDTKTKIVYVGNNVGKNGYGIESNVISALMRKDKKQNLSYSQEFKSNFTQGLAEDSTIKADAKEVRICADYTFKNAKFQKFHLIQIPDKGTYITDDLIKCSKRVFSDKHDGHVKQQKLRNTEGWEFFEIDAKEAQT